ncbi:histidinol-phosphate transaminase [Apophysomyces sp. BC1034]|nr:histidinol-phosphate transaminase [Apophysomyces sp. BC1015]KAG0183603.1 histidinol-phosphate transaminase [Apophysomyces sp. BC1021]KAG0183618.1 histidinol-phosphate transaminase [Apophysomyces sp. BC1021]KAG0194876.1 histidinol-phosphate transaminase [Apophysomyces sp. BC1034]
MPFDLTKVIRPNILALTPYRCARDDYSEGILLDANENAFGPSLPTATAGDLHRYPDPYHARIKERLIKLRQLQSVRQVFLGVGSDEVIDLVIRVTCVPAKDKILITPPTYGMYSVCAQINDVGVIKSKLNVENGAFQLRTDDIFAALKANPEVKIIFLCSPGNPTGTCLSHDSIRAVLESDFGGLVVVDEAYVDFVNHAEGSVANWVDKYPNLLVMQTLSKSFGLAGIRLGIAIGNPDLIQILNNTKAPYNIGTPSAQIAENGLSDAGIAMMHDYRAKLIQQRDTLIQRLQSFPVQGVGRILGANDANFVLVQILDEQNKPCNDRSHKVYKQLAESLGVVVRFRGKEHGCDGCLRMTVGTEEENKVLLAKLEEALSK